jgi:hypothetical protein
MILQKHVLKQQKKEFDRQDQRPILNFALRGKRERELCTLGVKFSFAPPFF